MSLLYDGRKNQCQSAPCNIDTGSGYIEDTYQALVGELNSLYSAFLGGLPTEPN